MRTLIIPDIHLKHDKAEEIILREQADRVVLNGDYFDDYHDNAYANQRTAIWLRSKLSDPRFIIHFGNHDVPYACPISQYGCPGWNPDKHRKINQIMGGFGSEHWMKMELASMIDGWLISHAGFHSSFLSGVKTPMELASQAKKDMFLGNFNMLLAPGRDRMGMHGFPIGGITWIDWDSLDSNPLYDQIVGHTIHKSPVMKAGDKRRVCLDCNMRNYGIIEDGKLEIKET